MTKSTEQILERIRELVPEVKNIFITVQLNHLLIAVSKSGKSMNVSQFGEVFQIVMGERKYGNLYNLSLSVEQNLNENESLRNLISELIF